jgi:hypothetical protein
MWQQASIMTLHICKSTSPEVQLCRQHAKMYFKCIIDVLHTVVSLPPEQNMQTQEMQQVHASRNAVHCRHVVAACTLACQCSNPVPVGEQQQTTRLHARLVRQRNIKQYIFQTRSVLHYNTLIQDHKAALEIAVMF